MELAAWRGGATTLPTMFGYLVLHQVPSPGIPERVFSLAACPRECEPVDLCFIDRKPVVMAPILGPLGVQVTVKKWIQKPNNSFSIMPEMAAEEVRQLLETMKKNEVIADINCKGRTKRSLNSQNRYSWFENSKKLNWKSISFAYFSALNLLLQFCNQSIELRGV